MRGCAQLETRDVLVRAIPTAVISWLDRATQYAASPAFYINQLRLLDPRTRGDDSHCVTTIRCNTLNQESS